MSMNDKKVVTKESVLKEDKEVYYEEERYELIDKLSPSTSKKDKILKKAKYEQFGVNVRKILMYWC